MLVVSSLGFIGTSAALLKAEGVRFAAGPIVFLAIAIIVPTALVSRESHPVSPGAGDLTTGPTSRACTLDERSVSATAHRTWRGAALAFTRAAIWLGRASVAAC